MRKWIIVAGVVVAALLTALLIDNHQGTALVVGDGNITTGGPVSGQDVYFFAPTLESRGRVELVGITPEIAQPGLEFVEARVYVREDFLAGVPNMWSARNGDASNPTKLTSTPVAGYVVAGLQRKEDVVFLHFRVTTDVRPLNVTALRVTYRKGFREHTQVVDADYFIGRPPGQAG